MSFPDVVKSTGGQGHTQKAVVNVTQRSQPSSAALIENEAGIKKGHVNSIASLFKPKPSSPAAKQVPPSRGRTTARASNEPSLSEQAPNWSVTRTGVETSPKTSNSAQPQPLPQPKGQLKQNKSFGKSDSDIFSSSTRLDSADAPAANKPAIVFNKTKYVPRLAQSADRSGQADQPKAQPQGSDIPSPIRVGRWTVYETLPIKDSASASRSPNEVKQSEPEAKRKLEAEKEESKRRESQEKERIADAERRKANYDRRQREQLESQERHQHDKQAADEERKRQERLERERKELDENRVKEETGRRNEQEQVPREQSERDRVSWRRKEIEEREEVRRREEADSGRALERSRREQVKRDRENEARQRKEAEERQEIQRRQEVERQVEQERMRQEYERQVEQERMRQEYERKQREAQEDKHRWEKRFKEEEAAGRMAEERKMRDSSQDVFTAEEWTVIESVPLTSAEIPSLVPTRVQQQQESPSYLPGSSITGYRRFLTSDDHAAFDKRKAVEETEYDRSLRQLEEARRNQLKEDEAARQRSRDAERQRDERMRRSEEQKRRDEESRLRQLGVACRCRDEEESGRRQCDRDAERQRGQLQQQRDAGNQRGNEEARLREGLEQWSALADLEDLGRYSSAVGYRRFLGNDDQQTANDDNQEAWNRQASENDTHYRGVEQERLRREEERRRREIRESDENRRRREMEDREKNRRRLEEDQRQREYEYKRRADEEERHRRRLEDDRKRRELELQRASQQRWRNLQDNSDAFSKAEWTAFESVPAKDSTSSYTAGMHRSPSHDSITGYRRLIEDSTEQPKSNPTNRYYERKFSRKDVPSSLHGQGHTLTTRQTAGSHEEATRFEEWTEYHAAPPRLHQSSGSKGDFRHQERRPFAGRGKSDSDLASTEEAPKFEEWTVVHKVPATQSTPAYDTTDFGFAIDRTSPSKDNNSSKRRFKSTESLSLIGSGELSAIEEIMPRRCDTGKRKKDAMIAAALRQLETCSPPAASDDDGVTARLSPYHSYQRIHNRRGPYQQQSGGAGGGTGPSGGGSGNSGGGGLVDNGNVFQDSFAVTRDNPAFYWLE